ncbi:MAG: hypothetical protein LBS43_11355, partial [Prevotellaceae bacterium]|nr:hypothetical protein [Prevotellaceae bacterium]
MKRIFILAWVCIMLGSCKQDKPAYENADIRYKGDTIVVSEKSPVSKDIVVGSAQLQDFSAEFRTVGTVRPASGKLAGIAPPFAG